MTKKECRSWFRQEWAGMAEADLAEISERVCRQILTSPQWDSANGILAYLSFGKEISLDNLIIESLKAGKTIALPLIESKTEMTFRMISSWKPEEFIINPWGIREPSTDAPEYKLKSGDLILVPGLGFSGEGKRIGRGGGYYDRFLAKNISMGTFLMGITCNSCLSDHIPVVDHDIPVQSVCTETGIISP